MTKTKNFLTIKNWSQDDRPREKLRDKGKSALSDAELLAILIGSGNRSESAVGLSKRIMSSVTNNLNSLGKLSLKQLMDFNGIGEAKAIMIMAAMELGRRRQIEEAIVNAKIGSSLNVFDQMQPIIGELPHEEFWILYLNNSNHILLKQQLSKGGITGTLVDIRLVLKQALELSAVAIILAHNHPSGTLKPSEADKKITLKLKKAAQSLDIKVLDHLIITEKAYFSFADENLL
ncbi:RadC family protein [Psychroserpens sp.]|uniref:RadC family protein n=1 Tax=Psychroserpens sp. TaxID=2020870 RepID=UPI001B212EDA|nr:DNA repair protein RadC [Psychroserpens sp.]MBO6606201.1 DNA repair protein RadC [Psychroserpens sp.]MBO6631107.1 DNA repair protein RadC [Psychroserpens sp.]MBO6652427.1 DNA repair protein RadC [Psychroserpens sp.]MBO6681801.1 DNA repair protein RadC [Psychroserpens sp.]MBO6749576.1 DNA repair protein RadC [Psychroserpens sp.]